MTYYFYCGVVYKFGVFYFEGVLEMIYHLPRKTDIKKRTKIDLKQGKTCTKTPSFSLPNCV